MQSVSGIHWRRVQYMWNDREGSGQRHLEMEGTVLLGTVEMEGTEYVGYGMGQLRHLVITR